MPSHSLAQSRECSVSKQSTPESGQPRGFPDIELECEPKVQPLSGLVALAEVRYVTADRGRGQACHQNTTRMPSLPSAHVRTRQGQRLRGMDAVAKLTSSNPSHTSGLGDLTGVIQPLV